MFTTPTGRPGAEVTTCLRETVTVSEAPGHHPVCTLTCLPAGTGSSLLPSLSPGSSASSRSERSQAHSSAWDSRPLEGASPATRHPQHEVPSSSLSLRTPANVLLVPSPGSLLAPKRRPGPASPPRPPLGPQCPRTGHTPGRMGTASSPESPAVPGDPPHLSSWLAPGSPFQGHLHLDHPGPAPGNPRKPGLGPQAPRCLSPAGHRAGD